MTVVELIEQLKQHPPDALIVQSKDNEGNDFLPSADVGGWVHRYIARNTWSGDLADEESDPDDGVPCVVPWPTN